MEEHRMQRRWHALAAVSISVAGLTAQTLPVKVEGIAATPLVTTTSDSVGTVVKSLPKDSDVSGGFTLSAAGNAGNAATLDFALTQGAKTIEAVLRSVASATNYVTASADSGPGPATIKLHLASPTEMRVTVTVSMTSTLPPTQASGQQIFTSPRLGTIVHYASQGPGGTQTYQTVLGPSGLDISLSSNFTSSSSSRLGGGSTTGILKCTIAPDFPWRQSTYGFTYGVTLTAVSLFQPALATELTFADSRAPAQAWICFGAARRYIPILHCTALNDWTVVVPVTIVQPRSGSILLAPPPSLDIVLQAQAVTWGQGTLHTSAGIELIPAKL